MFKGLKVFTALKSFAKHVYMIMALSVFTTLGGCDSYLKKHFQLPEAHTVHEMSALILYQFIK
jgi:outer membrane lipopolysaccharide assembly protein LptE/RlpB